MTPRDFYFFQLIRNDYPDMSLDEFSVLLIQKLGELSDKDLTVLPSRYLKHLYNWVDVNLLQERLMTVEKWLEMGFHLCKQRWDSSLDWLEDLPMSKILAMVSIQGKFLERQNEEIRRSARKK